MKTQNKIITEDYCDFETAKLLKEKGFDVKSFHQYYVSSCGKVFGCTGEEMKQETTNRGYKRISLSINGKHERWSVHRLVALLFIPNPEQKLQVNHKDENPCNNHVNNLEWCDRRYNNNYGGHNMRIAKSRSKPIYQFTLDGKFLREWMSATEASRQLGIAQMAINSCCLHKPKYNQAGGFLWKFKNDDTPIIYKHGKRILKYSANGTFINEYENITTACLENNLSATSISNCINGRSKTAGGYKWKLK